MKVRGLWCGTTWLMAMASLLEITPNVALDSSGISFPRMRGASHDTQGQYKDRRPGLDAGYLHDSPHGKMSSTACQGCVILLAFEIRAIPNFNHVQIIPPSTVFRVGAVMGIHPEVSPDIDKRRHALPVGADIVADSFCIPKASCAAETVIWRACTRQPVTSVCWFGCR